LVKNDQGWSRCVKKYQVWPKVAKCGQPRAAKGCQRRQGWSKVVKRRPRVTQGGRGGQDETRMAKSGQVWPRIAKATKEQQGGVQIRTEAKGDGHWPGMITRGWHSYRQRLPVFRQGCQWMGGECRQGTTTDCQRLFPEVVLWLLAVLLLPEMSRLLYNKSILC
jgi:hypothetical protein